MADLAAFDARVRAYIFNELIATSRAPTAEQTAASLHVAAREASDAYRRLADGHILILQSNGDIMAANPYAAVPTPFRVEIAGRSWNAICIWDALGIAANMKQDAVIHCTCGDCGDYIRLEISTGHLTKDSTGVIHISVPAKHWWQNIVFS